MDNVTGLNRNQIDKYYTKEPVANNCLALIKKHINLDPSSLIIEPSAGNGVFITGIKTLSNNYRFYDIKPEHDEIIKQDYITLNTTELMDTYSKIHIVGNPPFGRQSSLAIKFIKKSCKFCDSLSFILPKSFKKESLKKTIPLNFHLILEIDLPEKSFLVDDKEYDVPCIFQIWEKRVNEREKVKKLEPKNFTFVKKTEEPDISFRRVGVNAGTIDTNIDKSIQSHYFIKFTKSDQDIDKIIDSLKDLHFDHENTVGPKSISKQELIKEFNIVL